MQEAVVRELARERTVEELRPAEGPDGRCRFWCRFVVDFDRPPSNTVDIVRGAKCLRALQNR